MSFGLYKMESPTELGDFQYACLKFYKSNGAFGSIEYIPLESVNLTRSILYKAGTKEIPEGWTGLDIFLQLCKRDHPQT
jgi:hypothetical protein